jgi:hypothetical protein
MIPPFWSPCAKAQSRCAQMRSSSILFFLMLPGTWGYLDGEQEREESPSSVGQDFLL